MHPKEKLTEKSRDKVEKDTTIKVPLDLKDELDAIKVDEKEPYASVIKRLLAGKPPSESNEETVSLSLPRKVYRMMLMILPANLSDQMRKGAR